ncbi:MAG: T9SS type A sorting domain-containing protein [Candidatus Kapabacteria bacterium]|nr:T9SS type A sorting domain-containing protein [Candidatus Kapabacteria bacterium]
MKNFATFLFALLLFSSSLFGWTKGSFFQPDFILNPYNDEEIVFTASSNICRLDINSGNLDFASLSISNSGDIKDVIINGESKRIGYLFNGRIAIFNYMDFTEVANFTINYVGDSQDTKVSFSKDGNKVYTFKKSELRLSVYDIPSVTKSDEIIINANPTFYSAAFLNSDKAEFALLINDSLEIWSIPARSLDRKIPFDSNAELLQFRNSGDNITYKIDDNIYIVDSQTGAEIYSKTLPFDIYSYEFSANMQYMICREEYREQSVWDIVSDTLIFEGYASHSTGLNYIYINSNKTRAIGFIEEMMFCGRLLDMPLIEKVYYLFDMNEFRKISALGDGYLGDPINALINPTNKLILVSSNIGYEEPNYIHGLVDDNGKFLKFINVNRAAIAFSHDSKYIAFNDTSGLMLYNIESGIVEKTLKIQRSTLGKIFFSPQNGGLIVSITKDYIDVYDYNTLTLNYSKEIPPEEGYVYKLVCDLSGKISIFYQSGRYLEFDTETGDLAEIILNNLPEKREFRDMTNDGKYILWSVDKDSIVVYDIKRQNIKFSYKHNLGTNHAESISIGFLGIHEIVWLSYIDNPINKSNILHAYDFVEEQQYALDGEGTPRVSMDGTRYMTFSCPYSYFYNSIRLPVSVFEGTMSENLFTIFPNPATEYIEISSPFINPTVNRGIDESSDIKIFNTLGECVVTVETRHAVSLQRIDISHLPCGVYYLRIGSRTQMFVKI